MSAPATRRLEGRHAAVTGASRGIGLAIAQALAAEGARVTMLGRDMARLAAAASSIGPDASVAAIAGDVTSGSELAAAFRAARDRFGPVQILVANAGVIGYSTEQEFHTMKELVPELKPNIVILCFFANDVHRDHHQVLSTQNYNAEWGVAKGWLEQCVALCRVEGIRFAVAAIPDRSQLSSRNSRRRYQHRLEQIANELGIYLIDPDERFLSRRRESLYLQGDDHLSAAGHELMAAVLADHVVGWVH